MREGTLIRVYIDRMGKERVEEKLNKNLKYNIKNQTKTKSEIKIGAILSYIIVGINVLIGFVYTPVLIRTLGQAEYGLYSLVYSFMSYLTILDFGLGNAIVVYTSKALAKKNKEEEHKLNGILFIVYSIIGVIVLILGIILFFNVETMFGKTMSNQEIIEARKMVIIFTINIALTFPLSVYSNIIIAYEKFIFNKVLKIIEIVTAPIITLPILLFYPKAWIVVIIITILNLLASFINVIYAKRKLKVKLSFKNLDFSALKEIFSYSFYVFLSVVVDKVNLSINQVILGATSGTLVVAVYAVGAKIYYLFNTMSAALIGVTLPKLSKMEEEKKPISEFNKILIQTGRIQFLILALVFSGFIIFGQRFLGFWAGGDYGDAYYITIILMAGGIIPLTQTIATGILRVKNRHKTETLIVCLIAVFNIIISIILAKLWGGIGAALGTFITYSLQVIILNIYYKKAIKLDTPKFLLELVKMTIPVVIISIVSYLAYNNFIPKNFIYLAIGIVIYTIIYIFTVWNFTMNRYEKDQVINVFKKVKSKLFKEKNSEIENQV